MRYKELKKLSVEKLIELYDTKSKLSKGIGFIREEIALREAEQRDLLLIKTSEGMLRLSQDIRDMTVTIRTLTWILCICSAVSVLLALFK